MSNKETVEFTFQCAARIEFVYNFVKCETNLQVSELSCLICQEQQPTCHRVMMHLENYVTLWSDSTSKQEVTNLLYLYKKI